MLKICLVFWKSEPQYAYKRYAYKKNMYDILYSFNKHSVTSISINETASRDTIRFKPRKAEFSNISLILLQGS